MSAAQAPMVTKDARHFIVPYHAGLANLIPHAKQFIYNNENFLVIPNDHAEAQLARNLGLAVPSPVMTQYDWCRTKPWEVQKVTTALLVENPRAYVLSTMGTGKTRAVLFAVDWLMKLGKIGRVLVVAPLSTLTLVWEAEVWKMRMKRSVSVLHGSKEKRLQALAQGAEICVINHHGVRVIEKELTAAGFDVIVFDELATYRNKSPDLWASADALVKAPQTKFAWGLTGSPTPNVPIDAWGRSGS